MNKKWLLTLFTLLLSHAAIAKDFEKDDFKNLMINYLTALKNQDEQALAKVTTKRFLKKFKKDGQLKRVFKAQNGSNVVGKFDITYKRAIVNKDLYMVNIKNPEDKRFDEDWYFVKVDSGKLLLDEMHNLK